MGKRISRANQRREKVRRRLLVERLGERRVLAAITGAVFDDANLSLQRDADEVAAPQRLVYMDANDNATLDKGETFVVGETDGTFEFANVADGTYLLRLFNGTQTQTQTVPVEATAGGSVVSVAGAKQLEVRDGMSLALTGSSVVIGDTESGSKQDVSVGNDLGKLQSLPDGKLLIVGTDDTGDKSWIVDPSTEVVSPIDLSEDGHSTPWSDVAIDAEGRGVVLEQAAGPSAVRAIDASDSGSVQVSTTTTMVPSDTQVLSSATGSRTVFAWDGTDGLQLSLWSNVTSSFISASPIDVSAATSLLAFDDASGLLAVRTQSGGVSVHDVDADFAPLHSMDDADGPVAIDGPRDLLVSISPIDSMLRLINLHDGELVADLAIDLSSAGQVTSLALGDNNDAVTVLGAAGVMEVALRKAAAAKVTIDGGQDSDPVLFGVALDGENTEPTYAALPTLVTNEDTPLTLPAPALLDDTFDAEEDTYVLVQRSQPEHGTATLGIDGSLRYVPDANFNGNDSVQVLLHDGRDASAEVTLHITVDATPDTPSGVNVSIAPVPEHIATGQPIGSIEVIDADGADGVEHNIVVQDPRFGVQGGQIIFIGDGLDFEQEEEISVDVTVTDPETNESIETIIAVTVQDENDPITGITTLPTKPVLFENSLGGFVAELSVEDQDSHQTHTITVDDDRFMVENDRLQLKDDVAVDFEREPVIVVNVTATEVPDGGTFTQEITIEVADVAEQPEAIDLSNETVMELAPGGTVGDVSLDGGEPASRFSFTVDDPRFEIDGTTLKLVDDQFVERASQTEIELTITAEDLQSEFDSVSETFVIEVMENETPYHNYDNPYDVDHSTEVTALDALAIINHLNAFGPGPVGQGDPGSFYDVNADGLVTALDALLVLNEMNRLNNVGSTVGDGERKAEGEARRSSQLPDLSQRTENDSADSPQDEVASETEDDIAEADAQRDYMSGYGEGPAEIEPVDVPDEYSSGDFAQGVDETLRLLSDDNA